MSSSFTRCTLCGTDWMTREEFLADPHVKIGGYQMYTDFPERGLFLFTHVKPGCNTTLAIRVGRFLDLYKGPIFFKSSFGTETCAGRCRDVNDLENCHSTCSNAHIRALLQIILRWPKKEGCDQATDRPS